MMQVAEAKNHIDKISEVCKKINEFEEKHQELLDETGFLSDAVGYLCDYRKVLSEAIEKAELNI